MTTATAPAAEPEPAAAVDASPRPHTRLPHVDALDGLRGAAVGAVLLHHAGHLTGGWLGVDLFFVLSGYLITALLLQGWKDGGSVPLGNFWARRARRLGPALIITLLGVSIYAVTVAVPAELLTIRWDGIATLFEVANWRTILTGGDYWASLLRPSPLRHTWSLSIEEQLYLVWPLILAAVMARKRQAKAVLATALALAFASAAAMVILSAMGASRSRLYYGTDTRASAVMLGAALAAARVTMGPERWAATRQVRHMIGLVGAAALLVGWAWLDGSAALPYQGMLPAMGVAGVAVLASIADRRHPGPVGSVLALPPLTYLGRISYGVYLYHWPLFLVLDETRTHTSGWVLTVVRIAVTVALAAVSYRFIEAPIRTGRWLHDRQARAAVPAAMAVAIIALVASTLGAPKPPGKLPPPGPIDASSVPGAPKVFLAGDSVPLLLGAELSKQKDELGVSVINRAVPGCHLLAGLGPIRGVEGNVRTDVTDCSKSGTYREELDQFHPDVSVLLFGEFPNQAVELEGRWTMPCQGTYMHALRSRLDSLVEDLRSTGAPVVLLTAPGSDVSWVVERVEPGMPERVECTNQMLYDIAEDSPDVTVIDLASFICPPGKACLEELDGANLREDGLHFKDEGAAVVNRWLMPQIVGIAKAAQTASADPDTKPGG